MSKYAQDETTIYFLYSMLLLSTCKHLNNSITVIILFLTGLSNFDQMYLPRKFVKFHRLIIVY